jgi:hypothetical protein
MVVPPRLRMPRLATPTPSTPVVHCAPPCGTPFTQSVNVRVEPGTTVPTELMLIGFSIAGLVSTDTEAPLSPSDPAMLTATVRLLPTAWRGS